MPDPRPSARTLQTRRRVAGWCALLVVVLAAGGAVLARRWTTPAPGAPGDAPRIAALDMERGLDAARQYLREGQPGRAETVLLPLLERAPDDQDALILMAEAMLSQGRAAEAYERYTQAIDAGPDHAELQFAAATVANMAGMTEASAERYARARDMDPANPKHPLYLAQIERKLGRLDAARASLERALEIDPDLAIAWGVLADLGLEAGRTEEAKAAIARARALEPRAARWRLIEARILRREGRPEAAARLLLALPEPEILDDPTLLAEVATCLDAVGRTDDAASMHVRAAGQRPEDPASAYAAALWLEKAGRPREAEVFASAAAGMGEERAAELLLRLREPPASPAP